MNHLFAPHKLGNFSHVSPSCLPPARKLPAMHQLTTSRSAGLDTKGLTQNNSKYGVHPMELTHV